MFNLIGASLIVAIQAVKKGAAAEGMTVRDYVWRGHDPTSVAVMTEVIFFFGSCIIIFQADFHWFLGMLHIIE